MSDAYAIKLEGEGETKARLEKLYSSTTLPAGLHEAIAKAAADKVREHLKARDSSHPNVMGGKRSHFYWHAAESVQGEATVEGAVVTINHLGLRQRWLGGDIFPINAKYLAIPARAESYGVSPRDFPGELKFIMFRSGAMALVKADPVVHEESIDESGNVSVRSRRKRTRSKTTGLVEYWLKDHVYQSPDPTVLPSPEEMLRAVTPAVGEYLSQNE